MKEIYVQIPPVVKVGGVQIDVKQVERCENNKIGLCLAAQGTIEIADLWDKDCKQCESSKRNTFFHELTHCILDTMGEGELSGNEKFVCTFSSFLNEAMANARFLIQIDDNDTAGD